MSLPEYFFNRVSADIRQQMDGILALAEQLARQRLAPEAEACVAGVAEAAAGVRRLMDAALDLKATALEGLELRPEPVRLRDLMDEVQARWSPKAADTATTLLVSYDGDPDAVVVTDRERLLQVFDGLIGEAVGARRRGAVEASLRARAAGASLRLEGRVRSGSTPGWQGQDLESRVRAIDERLGLEIALRAMLARRIVERMSGRLHTETSASAAETLAFEIEAARAAEAPEAPAPAAPRPAHVLVVDDNATNRMVAQSLVEMFDCTCECAEDGLAAVEAARSGRFDLILMDIRMPRMDGVTAAREIRGLPGAAGATPIIALTANADPDDAAGYLAAGMNGVVEKPMKPEHLLRALRQALGEEDAAAA